MTWTIEGKQVLVTGGTSGIGRATAAELARQGARVTITSRSALSARTAADDVGRETGAELGSAALDLTSFAAVRSFVDELGLDRLDVLVNNAGTMTGRRLVTRDGFEQTFQVNYLAPFLLTGLLADRLTAAAPSRVIAVSSENYRGAKGGLDLDDLQMVRGFSPAKAYAASKLALILFTAELDRRLVGVTARALHPGVVATSFGSGPDAAPAMRIGMRLLKPFLLSPQKGARTSVHLATAQAEELGRGLYWSGGVPKALAAVARDGQMARRLWEISAELTGLDARPAAG